MNYLLIIYLLLSFNESNTFVYFSLKFLSAFILITYGYKFGHWIKYVLFNPK